MNRNLIKGILVGLMCCPIAVCIPSANAQDDATIDYKFVHVRPNGTKGPDFYQILADFGDGAEFPMLDVRTRTKAMSMEDRAVEIVKRLKRSQAYNPEWYKTLKADDVNGEKTVAPVGIPKVRYIATADRPSLGPWGCENTDDLAHKLIEMLTKPFHLGGQSGSTRAEKVRGLASPESLMMEGDRLAENDPAQAKLKYQEALKMKPDYPYVQLQLARIYLQEGERRKAREMVTAAEQHPKLAPELTETIESLKANLK